MHLEKTITLIIKKFQNLVELLQSVVVIFENNFNLWLLNEELY